MLINVLVIIVLSALAWACFFPQDALAILAGFKHQIRLRVIRRHGEAEARILERKMLDYATRRGIAPEQVKEILADNRGWIIERLGSKAADELLGEADPGVGCY